MQITLHLHFPDFCIQDAPGAEAVTAILQMAPTPVEESLKALLLHLDTATRDGNGGRFWDWHQNAKQF